MAGTTVTIKRVRDSHLVRASGESFSVRDMGISHSLYIITVDDEQ